jgi:rhamnogalacturonan endolyase
MMKLSVVAAAAAASLLASVVGAATGPFLTAVDNQTWIIGNEIWNMTQGHQYGVKLYYKDHDCVGDAVGHYVSYSMPPALAPFPHPSQLLPSDNPS